MTFKYDICHVFFIFKEQSNIIMSKCEQCIIKQFNSLKSLTKDELLRISNCKTSRIIKKGEVIFEEGETVNGVYCVKDGICKLSKLSANGKDQIVKMLLKGSCWGNDHLLLMRVLIYKPWR
jgi:CRP-like cAMP-binding protein